MLNKGDLDKVTRRRFSTCTVLVTLPTWMIGFFAAVIFGAILSSFNSSLNSAATLCSALIYTKGGLKEMPRTAMVKIGKIFGIIIAIGAILLGPFDRWKGFDGLFDLMKKLAALYNIPIAGGSCYGNFPQESDIKGCNDSNSCRSDILGCFWIVAGNNLFGHQITLVAFSRREFC